MTLDPFTRRALHMDRRVQSLRDMGVEVRPALIEKEVADDLRLIDRVKAEGALGGRRKSKIKTPAKKQDTRGSLVARPELHAEALARKTGGQFYASPVNTNETHRQHSDFLKRALKGVSGVDAERLVAMEKRIAMLSERGPGRIKADQSYEQGPWLYPSFVRMIVLTTLAFSQKLGGYHGLRYPDRRRRFFRQLEDICNKSNAVLGVGWWVVR